MQVPEALLKRSYARSALAAILALALALRLWGVGWGLPNRFSPLRSFHPDEAHVFEVVSRLKPATLDFDPKLYEHPNFFIYSVAGWLGLGHVLGQVELVQDLRFYAEDPDQSARIYRWGRFGAVLLGVGCVLLVFASARELYGVTAGLWAAAVAAVLPILVVDAHYVKTDTPQTFWLTLAFWLASRFLVRGGSRRWLLGSAAAAALSASTKYSAAMALAVPVLAILCAGSRGRRLLLWASASAGVFGLVFALANPFVVWNATAGAGRDILYTFSTALRSDTLHLDLAFAEMPPGWLFCWTHALWYGAGPFFEAALALAILAALRRRLPADRFTLAVLGVLYLTVGASWARFLRYWVPLAALGAILVGGWLAAGGGRRFWRLWLGGLLLAYAAMHAAAMDRLFAAADPRLEASEWIERNIPPGQPVGRLRNPNYAGVYRLFQLPPILHLSQKVEDLGFTCRHPYEWMPPEPAWLSAPDRSRYLVLSSYETEDYLRLADSHLKEAAFVLGLRADVGYGERAKFERYPELFGLRLFPWRDPPHDWRYAWPAIWIYERAD